MRRSPFGHTCIEAQDFRMLLWLKGGYGRTLVPSMTGCTFVHSVQKFMLLCWCVCKKDLNSLNALSAMEADSTEPNYDSALPAQAPVPLHQEKRSARR